MASVKPAANFDAEADAGVLRKAMKGLGTDEDAIIDLVGARTAEQRLKVAKMFKTMYGKDLIKELKSELRGHFEDLVVTCFNDRAGFDAAQLRKAMKGAGTDEQVLAEIICTRSNGEIEAIKSRFKEEFSRNLEDDVSSETSGHFRRLLVSCLQANRDESTSVDQAKAEKEAQDLYAAGEGKLGTDESKFNHILALRSQAQCLATFDAYAKVSGYDIERSIEREFSGDVKKAFLAVVKTLKDPPQYFADQLYKSMNGIGTDDDTLNRIVVSRCETDMEEIKDRFFKSYKKSLAKMIKDDVSGDKRKLLFKLIGDSA